MFRSSLNLCELYYQICRRASKTEASLMVAEFLDLGLFLCDDMDIEFWQDAGDLKAIYKRVSLADCCAVVLTRRLGGELVTSDHHELDALADLDICTIRFFR